jgi:hypothetical protein
MMQGTPADVVMLNLAGFAVLAVAEIDTSSRCSSRRPPREWAVPSAG